MKPRPQLTLGGDFNCLRVERTLLSVAFDSDLDFVAHNPMSFRPELQLELFRSCVLGSWVAGANMRCKLFVARRLKVAHHFIERCAGGITGGFEAPVTFGTTKTPKMLSLNPYQLPSHGRLYHCAPNVV
jgi:hypothetical protein